MEAHYLSEQRRPGSLDLKWQTLQHDGYCCRRCGCAVTAKNSHADHIVPVRCFPSYALSNTEDNLQTLCLACHKGKHCA